MSTRRAKSRSSVGARAGYTLFELLAVLTVIAIGLSIIVGSYNSWGTAHALTGATRTVEAGLLQARILAMSQHAYVAFSYGSTNSHQATLAFTTGFQPFFCTNETTASESQLQELANVIANENERTFLYPATLGSGDNPLVISPAAPFQRLPRHVRLSRWQTMQGTTTHHNPALLIFRPDGSILQDTINPADDPFHYIALETAESFSISQTDTAPLFRIFRIDPSTGLTTVIGETSP